MRTSEEIKNTITQVFEEKTNQLIRPGSVIDLYNNSISDSMESMYQEIEDAKNPHLYSKLSGTNLDDMCAMVGIVRRTGETDKTLLYRLHNWTLENAKGNTTAIDVALLDLTYASNVTYVPKVYGCGTGVAYVIPKDYSNETIANALTEAKERLKDVISPSLYIQYIVPRILPVRFQCAISVRSDTDISIVESLISLRIKNYIDAIAPKEMLSIGTIEKDVLALNTVTYFRIISYSIDSVTQTGIEVLQNVETKMMFDDITWTEV